MKIEKLELKGFGKLNNLTIELKDGLNVVFGNNEAGKSSIQWFIRGMFYGLKGGRISKEGIPPAIKRFKPWIAGDYSGIIEYRLDNGEGFRVGRNYSTNSVHIFDSLFNDITNTFDLSKEKGVQFAEKQLGMNEVCFEKTVFIRQMESKVDEDGSKELLNKLTNVAQTGFEDISFRKAQEALKEALKNYVGTDKTSTRPLDRVTSRMEQLGTQKNSLIKKRESMFSIENDLNSAESIRNKLQNRKQVFSLIKDLLNIERNISRNIKQRNSLDEIVKNISIEEEELTVTQKSVQEFNKTKGEFEGFAAFNNDDIDKMGLEFYEVLKIKDINSKLEKEILIVNAEKERIQFRLEELKGFESLGEYTESNLFTLKKDLERLKLEYEKNNLGILNERIKSAKYKDTRGKYNVIAAGILSFMFILIGLYKIPLGYIAAAVGLIATIILFILRKKESYELFDLLNQKKISFISINSIVDETEKKKNLLKGILSSVGAENIEQFLKLKIQYDSNIQMKISTIEKIQKLDSEFTLNSERIKKLDEKLRGMFKTAGIVRDEAAPICEEDIKIFKYGVRRYDGSFPSINYTLQRLEDINKNIAGYYDKASALCNIKMTNKEEIKENIYKIDELINKEAVTFSKDVSVIRNMISEKQVALPGFINLDKVLEEPDLTNVLEMLENENGKLDMEYGDILLKIRECETLLRSMAGSDDEIQRMDEEIRELDEKKNYLQDTNISLKTALEILTEASTEIQRDFAPALNQKMSATIKKITKGRYFDLRADDNLSLKTIAPETGEVVAAFSLSGGTLDQMYLALRIAMADLIAPALERIPLILDEVFAQYDDIRTREAFEFLKGISKERQIVFFTCKGREVEMVKEVCCSDGVNVIEL